MNREREREGKNEKKIVVELCALQSEFECESTEIKLKCQKKKFRSDRERVSGRDVRQTSIKTLPETNCYDLENE